MSHCLTVGELRALLATMPDEMHVVIRADDGDEQMMGDLRNAYIEHGCGSAAPCCILDGDQEASENLEDDAMVADDFDERDS